MKNFTPRRQPTLQHNSSIRFRTLTSIYLFGVFVLIGAFLAHEQLGDLSASNFRSRQLKLVNPEVPEVDTSAITPFAQVCPSEYPPSHAILHDRREAQIYHYNNTYGNHVRKWNEFMPTNYDFPQVLVLTNFKYTTWNSDPSVAAASAWDTVSGNHVGGPGWVEPNQTKVESMEVVDLEGDFAAYHSWSLGNFGHFVHDWLPTIAFLRTVVPETTKFLIVDTPVNRKILHFLDFEFYNRVVWIALEKVYNIKGDLTIQIPAGIPNVYGCCNGWDPLRQWIAEKHPDRIPNEVQKNKHVIFYSRGGSSDTKHGRVLDPELEKEVLQHIRDKLKQYGRDEEIVIFTGQIDGRTLSIEEQYSLFRGASAFIGPHGSGLGGNFIWTDPFASNCEERFKILEFMPGPETPEVHAEFAHYYGNIRKWPFDYHTLLYTSESTPDTTYINLDYLDDGLDALWGNNTSSTNTSMPIDSTLA